MSARSAKCEVGMGGILLTLLCALWALTIAGCMAQQYDLKQTEKNLQQKIKQSNEELMQTRARQSQEISALREQDLPQLRDQLERAQHQAQELQNKQDDLKQRSMALEQQTKKLEQLAGKLDTDSATRYSQVRESLNAQDLKNKTDRDQLRSEVNSRLDEINRQMELLRKDIIEVVQKTNSALVKSVDLKLDEQHKSLAENQARTEQLSNKFTQFSQALVGFRESLTGLADRVSQEEQASKALTQKIDMDAKVSTNHLNDMNKAVSGHLGEVNKSVASVAQKLAARIDEQDHRLDTLTKTVEQIGHEGSQRAGNNNGNKASQRQSPAKPMQRSAIAAPEASQEVHAETSPIAIAEPIPPAPAAERVAAAAEDAEEVSKAPPTVRQVERPDKVEYERLLGSFRDGDLEGARQGFAAFLSQYPNSDLAPNARYWLGESHYGKKDYKQAIDAYDRVELDYPQSEKVP
ncbi:MAG TPA: tetratricopeptide repeat protein, partial [Nitrospira sp.]